MIGLWMIKIGALFPFVIHIRPSLMLIRLFPFGLLPKLTQGRSFFSEIISPLDKACKVQRIR
ncbi:hypothetical protein LINPERHAP1_LOCUS15915 [Linum perenne]